VTRKPLPRLTEKEACVRRTRGDEMRSLFAIAAVAALTIPAASGSAQSVVHPRSVPTVVSVPRVVILDVPADEVEQIIQNGEPVQAAAPSRERRFFQTPQQPFFGTPRPEAVKPPEVVGQAPAGARPDRLPYFGERPEGTPPAHFMDPRIPVTPEPQR
jgi:hypothetical protein